MNDIFLFNKPVEYLKAHIEALPPKEKRGIHNRLATAAGVFPSYLSLILKEERSLNSDQALGIANYLSLGTYQRRYFLRMTELERAATPLLRQELEKELQDLRQNHHQISDVVNYEKVILTADDLAKFYSSWVYAAVRLATVLPECKSKKDIAERVGISVKECDEVLHFLLDKGLCKRDGDRFTVGPSHMHLEQTSLLIQMHHSQWRMKAVTKHRAMNHSEELAYSLAICLSKEDAKKVRSLLIDAVSSLRKVSDPSESETLYLLNLDWLSI